MGNGINRLVFLIFLTNIILTCTSFFVSYSESAESGSISGTWVANGSRDILPFGENRTTSLFKLSGHVNLKDPICQENDYWSECIGLADTETGSEVRCVWRSLDGQKIFLVLKVDRLTEGSTVNGKLVGGTETAADITGSLTFKWSSMSFQQINNKTAISGYAQDLEGSYELP